MEVTRMPPHNPYATPNAAIGTLEEDVSDEAIDALDVSDTWKARFKAIHHAGGVKLDKLKQLEPKERRKAFSFNVYGFFFGPIYYAIKGMWKKGLSLFLACAVVVIGLGMGLDYFGYSKIANALGYGVSAVFAVRANIDFYKKRVLGDNGWW
jgi:hypothetical protein